MSWVTAPLYMVMVVYEIDESLKFMKRTISYEHASEV